MTSGRLRPEGEKGGASHAAILANPESYLVVDLGEERMIRALVFQFDADDVYMIERSTDGQNWSGLIRIGEGLKGAGLRTQHAVLPTPLPAKFLAVHAEGGDGKYFVSQLQAYSELPTPWPPVLIEPTPVGPASVPTAVAAPGEHLPVSIPTTRSQPQRITQPRSQSFTEPKMIALKGLLAAAGLSLLAWGYSLERRARGSEYRKLRDFLLASVGVLGLAFWWNLGYFHFENYVHIWDTFHYYVGAKYQPELGYTRLYECSVAADVAQGRIAPANTVLIRNLTTNHLEPLQGSKALAACTPYFSPERWQSFVADVGWFHDRSNPTRWGEILADHGYNATPAWGILGRILANTGPASEDQIGILTGIDSALLLVMWLVVAWAWSWRAAAVAALFWGTFYPARFWWNGGAFLRMDWLFCMAVGLSLLRKGKPRAAGALLCFATLLRIFPGAVLLGLVAVALARMAREKRIRFLPEELRLATGFLATLVLVLPLSVLVSSGGGRMRWSVWQEFAENSKKHLTTPLTNNMGLRTVFTYRTTTRAEVVNRGGDVDPFAPWKEAHRLTSERMKPFYILFAAASLLAFAWFFRAKAPWLVAAAAVGLIPCTTELTCYYYSFLFLVALLTVEREELGMAFLGLSLISCIVPAFLAWDEDRYALLSLAVLGVLAMGAYWLSRARLNLPEPEAVKARENSARPQRRRR